MLWQPVMSTNKIFYLQPVKFSPQSANRILHLIRLIFWKIGVNATFVDLCGFNDPEYLTIDERIHKSFSNIDYSKTIPIATVIQKEQKELCANLTGDIQK